MATARTERSLRATNAPSRWSGPVALTDLPLTARALIRLGWELADERAKRVQAEEQLAALRAYVRTLPFQTGKDGQ